MSKNSRALSKSNTAFGSIAIFQLKKAQLTLGSKRSDNETVPANDRHAEMPEERTKVVRKRCSWNVSHDLKQSGWQFDAVWVFLFAFVLFRKNLL
jgi:hypothetical protein